MARYHTVVSDVIHLTPSILELSFQRQDQQAFGSFLPGQYATLSFPAYSTIHGERSFSIASSATELATLRFGIRQGGKYTLALSRLRPGDTAVINAPFGSFTYDPIRDQSTVMIAGGIGVTPFMSMIRTAVDMGLTNAIHLVYCIRSLADGAFIDELETLMRRSPNLRVTYVVSDGQLPANASHFRSGYVTAELLSEVMGKNPWGQSYFLCGPPKFMSVVTNQLVKLGLPKAAVRTERFSVGSTAIIEGGSPIPKWAFASWVVATAVVLGYIAHAEQEKRERVAATANVVRAAVTTSPATVSTDPVVTNTPVQAPATNTNTSVTTPVVNTNRSTPTTVVPTTPKVTTTPRVVTPTPVVVPPVRFQPRTTVS